MKIITLAIVFLIAGCTTTVPVKQKFPELPPELIEPCKALILLEGDVVTLSKLMQTVALNYSIYHECTLQQRTLVEWLQKQEKIFNGRN